MACCQGLWQGPPGLCGCPEVMVTVWPTPWKGGLSPRLSRGFRAMIRFSSCLIKNKVWRHGGWMGWMEMGDREL